MDLTSGILLFAIGIPLSVLVLYGLISWLDVPGKTNKKNKTGWKGDDCQ